MYPSRIEDRKKEHIRNEEGRVDNSRGGPTGGEPRNEKTPRKRREAKNKPRTNGRPEMGSEEVTLAAAEHACSAPKPKWSAKVRIPLVAQTLPKA